MISADQSTWVLTWVEMWDTSDSCAALSLILMESLSLPCLHLLPTAQSAHHMLYPSLPWKASLSKKHAPCCPFPLVSLLLFKSGDLKLPWGCSWSLCSLSCWGPLLGVRGAAPEGFCGCSKQLFSCCLFPCRCCAAPQRPLGSTGWWFSGSWPGAKCQL